MGSHPINLALRFMLEMAALLAAGIWGWRQTDSGLRYVLSLGIPLAMAALWGIFAVPEDPSRSGTPRVIIPGMIRLALEIGFFAWATWCFYDLGMSKSAMVFGGLVILHYLLSYDRILWLLSH